MIKSNKNTSKIGDEGELDHLFLVNFHVFLVQFWKSGCHMEVPRKNLKDLAGLEVPKIFWVHPFTRWNPEGSSSSFQLPGASKNQANMAGKSL